MPSSLSRIVVPFAVTLLAIPSLASPVRGQWRLDAEPAIRIAATADDGSVRFASALAAMRMADGSIVVADGQDAMLRVFDSSGRILRSFGRRGQGPGEFRQLAWAGQCGADTTYAWDAQLGRVVVFSAQSGHARQFTIDGALGSVSAACSASGEFAVLTNAQQGPAPADHAGQSPDGGRWELRRMKGALRVVDRTGALRFDVRDLLWAEVVGVQQGTTGRVGGFFRPLGDRTAFDFSAGQLLVGETDSSAIARYDATGAVTGTVRVPPNPTPITRELYDAAAIPSNAMAPVQMHETIRALARVVPMPTRVPAFTAVRGDPAGLAWLVRSLPGEPRTRFDVLDASGARVASLELAGTFTLHEVGLDYLLGTVEGADGEAAVMLHRLRRP